MSSDKRLTVEMTVDDLLATGRTQSLNGSFGLAWASTG
jgi:hypothetical protein